MVSRPASTHPGRRQRWLPLPRAVVLAVAVLVALIAALVPDLARSDGSGGVNVTVIPLVSTLEVEIVSVVPASPLRPGDRFRVTAVVTNSGSEQLRQGEATLYVDESGLSFVGQQTRRSGAINAARQKEVHWDLVADEEGQYVLMVEATAVRSSDGIEVMATDSQTIVVGTLPTSTGDSSVQLLIGPP